VDSVLLPSVMIRGWCQVKDQGRWQPSPLQEVFRRTASLHRAKTFPQLNNVTCKFSPSSASWRKLHPAELTWNRLMRNGVFLSEEKTQDLELSANWFCGSGFHHFFHLYLSWKSCLLLMLFAGFVIFFSPFKIKTAGWASSKNMNCGYSMFAMNSTD